MKLRKRGFFTSDWHLMLQTDDLDRTPEIFRVVKTIVAKAVKSKADFLILGGDLFDHNNPTEAVIDMIIELLVMGKSITRIYIFPGNHEGFARPGKRKSCLTFIRGLEKVFPNLRFIDEPKTVKFCKTCNGDVYFTFLPFLNRAHIKGKKVQKYYDDFAERILQKIPSGSQHYVFSHLNVPDCMYGTEQYMLKKVDIMLPEVFRESSPGNSRPIVINAHIHTRQEIGNINIVGSPVFHSFGEKERWKYFLEIRIPEVPFPNKGEGGLIYHKTDCSKLVEIDLGHVDKQTEMESFEHHFQSVKKNDIVKVVVTCSSAAIDNDWKGLEDWIAKRCQHVKPIEPRVIKKRVKRNKKQRVKLAPSKAVSIWLKNNKPRRLKKIKDLSERYIEQL